MPQDRHEGVARHREGGSGRRSGPRSEPAILAAAYELLVEHGLEATTVEAISQRAGVSKVTVYKWWPNRAAVIMSAFLHRSTDLLPYPDNLDPDHVRARLLQMANEFRGPTGAVIAALIAEAQTDPEIAEAFRTDYVLARRDHGLAIVREAMQAGRIRDGDPHVVLDLLYAPLYFRLLVGHQPLSEVAVRQHVDLVLQALTPPN